MKEFLMKCRDLAIKSHNGQMYGLYPYHRHLHAVRNLAKDFGFNETVQAACFLHDILEDTDMTPELLRYEGIPEDVIKIVEAVTDPPGANRKERKTKAYPQIVAGGFDAIAVKLCDRIVNVMMCRLFNPELLRMYKNEDAYFQVGLRPNPIESLPAPLLNLW